MNERTYRNRKKKESPSDRRKRSPCRHTEDTLRTCGGGTRRKDNNTVIREIMSNHPESRNPYGIRMLVSIVYRDNGRWKREIGEGTEVREEGEELRPIASVACDVARSKDSVSLGFRPILQHYFLTNKQCFSLTINQYKQQHI